MGEQVSTAGHGPSRGYSGMNAKLDKFLKKNQPEDSAAVSRSLAPRASDFGGGRPRHASAAEKSARALLCYMQIARERMDQAIATLEDGLKIHSST